MPPGERQALGHVVRHGNSSGPQLSPVGQTFVLSKRYGIETLQEFLKIGDARYAYLETLHIQNGFKRGIALDVLFHHVLRTANCPASLAGDSITAAQCLFLLLENPDTGRKPMQKIARANGANFTFPEEAGEGNRSRRLCNHPAIMVRLPIEVRAPAITGKEQGATGRPSSQVWG